MLRILRFTAGLLLGLLIVLAPANAKRVALVIGNDNYENVLPLKKAVNDARAIRDSLQSLKFEVVYRENASLAQLKQLGFDFTRKLEKGDIAFVFYAGHGVQFRGANYLLPVDAPKPNEPLTEADKRFEEDRMASFALSESFFIQLIRRAGAGVGILVMDACRDNPLRIAASDKSERSLIPGAVPNRRPGFSVSIPPDMVSEPSTSCGTRRTTVRTLLSRGCCWRNLKRRAWIF